MNIKTLKNEIDKLYLKMKSHVKKCNDSYKQKKEYY